MNSNRNFSVSNNKSRYFFRLRMSDTPTIHMPGFPPLVIPLPVVPPPVVLLAVFVGCPAAAPPAAAHPTASHDIAGRPITVNPTPLVLPLIIPPSVFPTMVVLLSLSCQTRCRPTTSCSTVSRGTSRCRSAEYLLSVRHCNSYPVAGRHIAGRLIASLPTSRVC